MGSPGSVLVIPGGYSHDLRPGETAQVQVVINGDNANTATTVLGYVTAVLATRRSRRGRPCGATLVGVQPRVWYNPELRSALFLVPGLIAFISMITAVISTALSVVREKERGTMEQMRMSPISTPAFILGKTIVRLCCWRLCHGDCFVHGVLRVHEEDGAGWEG